MLRSLDSGQCEDKNDQSTCRVIYDFSQSKDRSLQAVSSGVAATMTSMLQGVVQRGTGRAAAIAPDAAGKTGTTDDNKDLWFIGFIPSRQLVTGIWLGNDRPSPTRGSSAQATQLWANYMRQVGQ
jgi:penicillin-binding protein 1A